MPIEFPTNRNTAALMAALTIVAGCSERMSSHRPSLLGREQGKTAEVSWVVNEVSPQELASHALHDVAIVRVAACRELGSPPIRPKLIIGAPACGRFDLIRRHVGRID
jgi:hypothetical protein